MILIFQKKNWSTGYLQLNQTGSTACYWFMHFVIASVTIWQKNVKMRYDNHLSDFGLIENMLCISYKEEPVSF